MTNDIGLSLLLNAHQMLEVQTYAERAYIASVRASLSPGI
jgi:hypothetical protein